MNLALNALEYDEQNEQHDSLLPLSEAVSLDSLEPTLQLFFDRMLEEYPFLSHVAYKQILPKDEPHTGGIFNIFKQPDGTFRPTISIVKKDDAHFEHLMKRREGSVRRVADMLGISFEEMTPDLLRFFIIAHELGHATDYVSNYESNPDHKKEGGDSALTEWNEHYSINLMMMPVAGFDPAQLHLELMHYDSLEDFLADYHIQYADDLETLDDLQRAQDEAYRNSEFERYADDFARDFLLRNAHDLGFYQLIQQRKAA